MKHMFKASGTKRLNLKYDAQLLSFAFNFNWRRYFKITNSRAAVAETAVRWGGAS